MVKRVKKKAQAVPTGAGAATLILVILLLIIMYIMFIPAEEREKLLEGENVTEEKEEEKVIEERILLLESPGRLDYISATEMRIEHSIPSVNLYSKTEAEKLKKVESLYIKRSFVGRKFYNITFVIEDLANTENMLLSGYVRKCSGLLTVKLNGYEVFTSEVKKGNLPAIELPKNRLRENENVLEFEVSSVGWRWWASNEYLLENVAVSADITDVSTLTSRNIFVVSSTEKNNLESSRLRFFADCDVEEAGVLDIEINGHNIFSAVPDCGVMRPIDFPSHYIVRGENELVFDAKRGRYLIDNIMVRSNLKKIVYPTYYFEINDSLYEDIQEDQVNVTLVMEFINDIDYKKGMIYVNGHLTHLDTREASYERKIDDFLRKGSNAVELRPLTTLDIIELRIFYEE